jgi:hypothetical protein
MVRFSGPFAQNCGVMVVCPFLRPLAGGFPSFRLGADAGAGKPHVKVLGATAAAVFHLLRKAQSARWRYTMTSTSGRVSNGELADMGGSCSLGTKVLSGKSIAKTCALCVRIFQCSP